MKRHEKRQKCEWDGDGRSDAKREIKIKILWKDFQCYG